MSSRLSVAASVALLWGLLLAACGGTSASPSLAPASPSAAPPSAKPSVSAPAASQAAASASAKPAASQAVPSVAAKPTASGSAQASAAAAAKPSPPADWQAQLDRITAGARQEGALAVNAQPGPYAEWIAEFGKKYPFIKLEQTNLSGAQLVPRILPEQKAGQYLLDVHLAGTTPAFGQLVPNNAVDPLLPALLLPEILDDSKWLGGFNSGFADKAVQYVYSLQGEVSHEAAVNRDQVPASQLNAVEDLLDPKWKGKVSIFDPRIQGAGAASGGHFVLVKGADWWRKFLDTQPAITQDRRQQTEWLVRGQYPITVAPSGDVLLQFKKDGLGKNVEFLAPDSAMGHRLLYSFSVVMMTKAPHPNAAKLFLNWTLSREGQDLMQKVGNTASRRTDLGDVPGIERADPKVNYPASVNIEVNDHFNLDATNIAKEVLK